MIQEAAVLQDDLPGRMEDLGRAARAAAHELALAEPAAKGRALEAAAQAIRDRRGAILEANGRDMAAARAKGLSAAMLDRLELDEDRVEAMAKGLEDIAAFPDPVGRVLAEWDRPNGLRIARVSVPLGVIGIIYESRPNVTADAGGLCLKAGNAAILRGGSESFHSSGAILDCLQQGLAAAGLPEAAVQRVPTTDRAAVGLVENVGHYLGTALVSLVNIFEPEVIVLGGGVMRMDDLLLEPVRRELRQRALPPMNRTDVVAAELGPEAGMIGAAALARIEFGKEA